MIIAYLRVSTNEQAESGLGLAAQLEQITKAVGVPDAVYRDEGYSGSDPKRPALLAALEAVTSGDVLAVAKRDRLARDVYFSAWVEKEVKKCGGRVVSAAGEGTESDDPTSALMRTIIDAFAQFERDMIAARTAAALGQKKQRGEKTGGDVPFGHRVEADGDKLRLAVDPDEQAAVDLIAQLRQTGQSLRQIADELEARGIATKRGSKRWHPQVIKRILARTAA